MKKLIEKKFKEVIKSKILNESIRDFLLLHPRRHVLFDNIEGEIKRAEKTYPLDEKSINQVIEAATIVFSRVALAEKEKSIMSESGKILMQKEKDKHNEIVEGLENAEDATHIDNAVAN